jgi:hypothetical protein
MWTSFPRETARDQRLGAGKSRPPKRRKAMRRVQRMFDS